MTASRGIRTRRGLQMQFLRDWVERRDRNACWTDWPFLRHKGYPVIHAAGKGRNVGVARLAWELANGRPLEKNALHRCNDPACINPAHIYDGDQKDNRRDSVLAGTAKNPPRHVGARHPMAKLTTEQVETIRASDDRNADLARRFGVTRTMIGYIKKGQNWREA